MVWKDKLRVMNTPVVMIDELYIAIHSHNRIRCHITSRNVRPLDFFSKKFDKRRRWHFA